MIFFSGWPFLFLCVYACISAFMLIGERCEELVPPLTRCLVVDIPPGLNPTVFFLHTSQSVGGCDIRCRFARCRVFELCCSGETESYLPTSPFFITFVKRLSVVMEDEPPPPPYSTVDPLFAQSHNGRNAGGSRGTLPFRGAGNMALSIAVRNGVAGPSSSAFRPANFESAVAYFEERPPTMLDEDRDVLPHHLTIYPRSQAKDYPRRPRCWNSRTDEITQQDWDMFLRYLFPPHLGLASASGHLSRQLRAQIQRDRKDRPQETDEQRRLRTTAVIEEWNQCFFGPRDVQLEFKYITDPRNGPSSPLCPKCYPAATKANQRSRSSQSSVSSQSSQARVEPDRRQSSESSTPPVTPGQQAAPQVTNNNNNTPSPQPYSNPYGPAPTHYAPYGPPGFYPQATAPQSIYPAASYPPPPPSPYHTFPQYQYGWNNRPYGPNTNSSKGGGPLGWISSLASQAQKYGERFSEQAQHYGDQLTGQAEHYSRQVEDQVRWLEGQWPGGRKPDNPYLYRPRPDWNGADPRYQHYYYQNYNYPSPSPSHPQYSSPVNANMSPNTPTTPTTTNGNVNDHTSQRAFALPPQQRTRSASVDSAGSESSFASIKTLSTTSDISSSDLATVRAQLLSLEDQHDRELYESAVGLRHHLEDARKSHRGPSGQYQRQRSGSEQRNVKEGVRATRKAFRDVMRRAREEQREKRRIKRNRRRQKERVRQNREDPGAVAGASTESGITSRELPLEQRLDNIQLEKTKKHDSQQTMRSSLSTARSVTSSVASERSPISTPSTESLHGGERQNKEHLAGGGEESKPNSREARKHKQNLKKESDKQKKELEKLKRDQEKIKKKELEKQMRASGSK